MIRMIYILFLKQYLICNFVYIYRKLNHLSTLFIIRNTKLQIYVYQTCKGLKNQILAQIYIKSHPKVQQLLLIPIYAFFSENFTISNGSPAEWSRRHPL